MMKRLDKLLSAALIQQTQTLFDNIKKVLLTDIKDLPDLMRNGYTRAHKTGAITGLLGMTETIPSESVVKAVQNKVITATQALEQTAKDKGLELTITKPSVIERVETQAQAASDILLRDAEKPGAPARAAGYAVRWGVQEGVKDAAENSLITNGDEAVELLKTWIRLAARAENRQHHDALIGVTIPYSQKFVLRSPNGTFLIDRPYDPSLPLREKISCGHGIRVSPPKGGKVQPWTGGETVPAINFEDGNDNKPLPKVQLSRFQPRGVPISQSLDIPKGPLYEPVRRGMELLDTLHGDGTLERTPVRFRKIKDLGGYQIDNIGNAEGMIFQEGRKISLATVFEENAHMLDHQVLGERYLYNAEGKLLLASEQRNSPVQGVMDAIYETTLYKSIDELEVGQSKRLQRGTKRIDSPEVTRGRLSYAQNKREWFARAYVQWAAIRTGDEELLRHIARFRSTPDAELLYPMAWSDEEFAEIARELDSLFLNKGWIWLPPKTP